MKTKAILFSTIILLLILPNITAGAMSNGVDDLRGQWIFNWTLESGETPLPLHLFVNDIQSSQIPNTYLAAGCMLSPYSGGMMPLALTAVYDSEANTYDLSIYSTFVPSEGFGPAYLMRFDGFFEVNGSGVTDDLAYGEFQSGIGPGTWEGIHHDRRYTKCPPVDPGDQRLDMDVYAHKNLAAEAGQDVNTVFEGRGIQIVSSAMQVTAPDDQVYIAQFYTDIFSPGVDFVNEFRFVYDGEGAPITGLYHFVLLDVFGNPIAGTETQDTWTLCRDKAPTALTAVQNSNLDVELSWTGVRTIPGEFEPGMSGFYQIAVHPTNGPGAEFGSNGIISTNHLIPWNTFNPGDPGSPDGFDVGSNLEQFGDGDYVMRMMAFYQPDPNWGGFGLECDVTDNSQNLLMTKLGDMLTFSPQP
jgi:hypothetical protein